jgi:uncharacterized protein YyaL (SSP411 family)
MGKRLRSASRDDLPGRIPSTIRLIGLNAMNQLAAETSPYLLLHAGNPVHWCAWGPAALAEAARRDVPVLLSSGYAACHWCHVMARESFQDASVAALMNEKFVCVKLDREERPDIDALYQQALARMGEQGGWPLTMFVSPRGEPFFGGTYYPPDRRYGRPAFREILEAVSDAWATKRESVLHQGRQLLAALAPPPKPAQAIDPALLEPAGKLLVGATDPIAGGLEGAPKFPNAPIFRLLWWHAVRNQDPDARDAVALLLDNLCQGGIYDHLGGGIARYAVDARWLVPHFEKMLYDNAQFLDLLALAHALPHGPLYRARAAETVGWLLREMLAEGSAFAATLDAESEHEEGKFYVWQADEIDAVLGAEAALFKRVYGVRPQGNWEGKTILHRLAAMAFPHPQEPALDAAREKLFRAREPRIRPARDDKVLADWNGMMIAALARAAIAFDRPEWLLPARTAFDVVATRMDAGDGRLFHGFRAGKARHAGLLEDSAAMALAAIGLFEATGEPALLDHAAAWLDAAVRDFADGAGGYFTAAAGSPDVPARQRGAADNATPSGNGMMADALARMWLLTFDDRWRVLAEQLLAAFGAEVRRNPAAHPWLLCAADLLAHGVSVVVSAGDGAGALADAAARLSDPALVVTRVSSAVLPPQHPAQGKGPVAGRAAAYVCTAGVCQAPVTDAAELAASVQAARRHT